MCFFFFFKQKAAYEMRISVWSSDVCSSDLQNLRDRWTGREDAPDQPIGPAHRLTRRDAQPAPDTEQGEAAAAGRGRGEQIAVGERRLVGRSEERSVGKECVRKCRSRCQQYH